MSDWKKAEPGKDYPDHEIKYEGNVKMVRPQAEPTPPQEKAQPQGGDQAAATTAKGTQAKATAAKG